MQGRIQAVTSASVFAALSLLLPPLTYLSGAVTALATLRRGAIEGALVVLGSVILAGALTLLVIGTPYPVVVFALITWIPVWVLAAVLRVTASQGAALAVAGMLGAAGVIVFRLLVDDPVGWWREVLEQFVAHAVGEGGGPRGAAAQAQLQQMLEHWAPRMTGFMGAGTVLGLIVTLLLARWWHAVLDNPGGFAREFRALRLNARAAPVVIAIAVLALVANDATGGLAGDLLGPAVVPYLFQGLAVAHAVVAAREAPGWWLVSMYAALALLPPYAAALVAVAGLSDTWLRLRERWARP